MTSLSRSHASLSVEIWKSISDDPRYQKQRKAGQLGPGNEAKRTQPCQRMIAKTYDITIVLHEKNNGTCDKSCIVYWCFMLPCSAYIFIKGSHLSLKSE